MRAGRPSRTALGRVSFGRDIPLNDESVAWAHPDNDPDDAPALDPWAEDPELCGVPGRASSRDIERDEEAALARLTPPRSPSSVSLAGATAGLVRRWAPNAWTVLAAAMLVQSCAGLAYSFSVYSGSLREVYQSQSAVDLLGSFKDVGAYFGVLGGLVFDAFGPRVTLVTGAAMHTLGYLGIYATLRGTTRGFRGKPPIWRTGCLIALAANGNSFFDTAVLLSSMNNFPTEKGTVAGLLKSYLGLSSAIFAQLYVTVAPTGEHHSKMSPTPRPADSAVVTDAHARAQTFVLMIALIGGVVATLASPFIREVKPQLGGEGGGGGRVNSKADRAAFGKVTGCTVFLVGCAATSAALNDAFGPLAQRVNVLLTIAVLGALTSPVIALAIDGKLGVGIVKPRSALRKAPSYRNQIGWNLRGGSAHGRSVTFDSSADRGAWDDEDDDGLGDPLMRGQRGSRRERFNNLESSSDEEEDDRSSQSSDGRVLGDDDEWALNRAQIIGREGAFLHLRNEEDGYDELGRSSIPALPPLTHEQPPLAGREKSSLTLAECATCPEFWLLWFSIMASSGAAMALVNNMDAIAAATGVGASAAAGMVSLFSVCNCVGRLCGGAASESALHRYATPRPVALCVAQVIVAAGMFTLRVAPVQGGVFAAVSMVGFALGAHWGLAPSMSSEIFGAEHAGAVYGGLSVAPMIGSYALSTGVFGRMYDAAADAQAAAAAAEAAHTPGLSAGNSTASSGTGSGAEDCLGAGCFVDAMGICAAFALVAVVPCAIVSARTRHVYAHHRRRILAST